VIQLLSIIKFLQAKTIKAGPNCLSYTMTRLFDYDGTLCIKVNCKVFSLCIWMHLPHMEDAFDSGRDGPCFTCRPSTNKVEKP